MEFDYDLLVIGAGSGGVRAARMSASMGAKVAVVESRYLGGTCVNVGCVPKKLFVYASEYQEHFEDSAGYGYTVDSKPQFNWATLRDNKTAEIERLNGVYQRMLENAGVEIIDGHAEFESEHSVKVGDEIFSAKNILIATGSWPFKPAIPGSEHVLTSNEFFYMENFPKHAIVIGGGYIAVEFAGILNGLGCDTHIVYRGEPVLRGFDEQVRNFVSEELSNAGINLHYHTTIEKVEKLENGQFEATFNDGTTTVTDALICALGRKPLVEPLKIEKAGLSVGHGGEIVVNDQYQTSKAHIFAVGDVIGKVQLTPVALAEGMHVAHQLFSDKAPRKVNYDLIPTAVFCQPNLGTVGISEEEAAKQFDRVAVFDSAFKPMKNTLSGNPQRMLMKLLVDTETDKVIGCHMAGHDAGEIIQGIGVALQAGATKNDFDSTIGIHPTAAEEFVTMREPSRFVGKKVNN
ncbi:glutathione-disulfide reductase [Reinekea marina]|uniref:Glutathione-disulfide reductase n=1 Tax=Reinekea marina TaxID=1310421 RepID=A0ABV7WR92_9GAMM|nr:glutathione-disulfide reductase [Reinekea marina]MDN3649496.1 glutathione-disulfide reductase [Reinekea marina]